jgi:hypothetical protein
MANFGDHLAGEDPQVLFGQFGRQDGDRATELKGFARRWMMWQSAGV